MSPQPEERLKILGPIVEVAAQGPRARKRVAGLRGGVSVNRNEGNAQCQLNFDLFLATPAGVRQSAQQPKRVLKVIDGFHIGGICERPPTCIPPAANCPFVISRLAVMIGQNFRSVLSTVAEMVLQNRGNLGVNLLSPSAKQRIVDCITQQHMLERKTD